MLLSALVLLSLVSGTLADHCTDLARFLGPGVESYTSGRTCHGLFWVVAGESLICQHSSLTSSWCPDRHPVTQSEAESILAGGYAVTPSLANEAVARSALSLYTTASPTMYTTVSITPSADADLMTTTASPTAARRQRRVYPVSRSARPQPDRTPRTISPTPTLPADNVDVCRILHPESYETSAGLCHGLYWRTIAHTEFCYHSAATAHECPVFSGHEVSLGQAAEFVHQLNRETTSRPPPPRAGLFPGEFLPSIDDSSHGFGPEEDDLIVNHDPRINTNIRPLVDQ